MVDTVGFNGRNQNITEKMHITERFHLEKDGVLVDDMTLDDPNIYTQPYTITTRYRRAEGQEANELQEYACEIDPNNLFAFLAEQKAAGRQTDFNPGWAASNYNDPASVAGPAEAKDKKGQIAERSAHLGGLERPCRRPDAPLAVPLDDACGPASNDQGRAPQPA